MSSATSSPVTGGERLDSVTPAVPHPCKKIKGAVERVGSGNDSW